MVLKDLIFENLRVPSVDYYSGYERRRSVINPLPFAIIALCMAIIFANQKHGLPTPHLSFPMGGGGHTFK